MMLQAKNLAALEGIRHAFFTREGGVSEGLYESLNAGVGSDDDPARVAENRARMAKAVGVTPERFLTAYQIHSPDVVVAETPWTSDNRPRADAIVTRVPGLAIGISTADCGPVLFADPAGADHRRSPFRLARRGGRRVGSDRRCDGATRRRARPDRRRHRPDDQPAELRGGQRPFGAIHQGGRGQRPILRPGRPGHAQFDLPGFIANRLGRAGIAQVEDLGACTYADPRLFYSFRRTTHRREPDYGRHVNAIALSE